MDYKRSKKLFSVMCYLCLALVLASSILRIRWLSAAGLGVLALGVVLMLVVLSPLLSVAGLSGTLDSIYAEQTYDEELQDFTRRQAELEVDYAREIEKRKQEMTGDGTENPADGEEEQGGSSDIKVEIVLDE